MIAFSCPNCGKSFQVNDSLGGRRSRCGQCRAVTTIPFPDVIPLVEAPPDSPVTKASPPPDPRRRKTKPKSTTKAAWISLAIGFGLAVSALLIPLVGFVIHVLNTVIHELGHTATAWVLGSPALPSFDLTYGGGVSHIAPRQPILIIVVYVAFAVVGFRWRHERRVLVAVLAGTGLYSIVVFSPLRDLLILALGHGAELFFAGVFLYRALSGSQILRSQERPLYAFLGLYIVLADARIAVRLMTSQDYREEYGLQKGGGHTMDFSRIANEFLGGRVQVVAALFLVACVLTPVVAFLIQRFWRRPK